MLNLTQAFELYQILTPYLPDKVGDDEMLITYTKHVLTNMQGKDEDAYTRAMMLLTGLSRHQLVEFPVKELLDTFMAKLSENKIIELQKFMREFRHE